MFHWHTKSMTGRSPTLDSEVLESYVGINPQDAGKLGIEGGDVVEVGSRRGAIETRAF